MNTAITTLDHLVKFESEYNYSDSHRVLGFIRLQLNQKNTEVLDYFFSLLSKNEISKRYATDDFVSMILRSRWPAAHKALANYLIDHPYEVTSALQILGADKNVFAFTVEVIVESLKNNPPETSRHVQMLENLALAAVQNNALELYEWCHQQSLAIDPYTSPFEFRHDQICEQAVNYGAWWALKSIAQWCKPYVFYKAFEHATTFAPIEILEDLYTSFPHHFPVEFSGRAAEYLSKREPTPQMLELIARIVVKHPQVKIPNPLPLWELCQKFATNQQHADHALNVADRIWAGSLSSEPILFMLHILRDKKSVALSAPLLRHISQTHPETYAMAFTPVSRTHTAKKFAIPAEIVDELIFAVNDATDRLLVDNGYDTEKVNALRQNIALTHEVGQLNPKKNKRKI